MAAEKPYTYILEIWNCTKYHEQARHTTCILDIQAAARGGGYFR